MTEAILIEIAQRFRRLEEMCEDAQMLFAPITDGDPNDSTPTDLDAALEACRDDMVAMQSEIRKTALAFRKASV